MSEPEYVPGGVYQDAVGDLWERAAPLPSRALKPWWSFAAQRWRPEDVPTRPLVRLVPETDSRRELMCEDCHQEYTVWYADNDLWNAVMRPDGEKAGEPFLCARCFLVRAAVAGVFTMARVSRWEAAPSAEHTCDDVLCPDEAHYCPNKACCSEKGHDGPCDERAAL